MMIGDFAETNSMYRRFCLSRPYLIQGFPSATALRSPSVPSEMHLATSLAEDGLSHFQSWKILFLPSLLRCSCLFPRCLIRGFLLATALPTRLCALFVSRRPK